MAPLDMKPNELEPYWMPFTPNRAFKKKPRLFSGAKDMHYFTPDGRKVIDASSGLFCVNAGHGRDADRQGDPGGGRPSSISRRPSSTAIPQVFELSSQLALMAPGDLDYALFANSGSRSRRHRAEGRARLSQGARRRRPHPLHRPRARLSRRRLRRHLGRRHGRQPQGVRQHADRRRSPADHLRPVQAGLHQGRAGVGRDTCRRTDAPDQPARRLDHRRRHRRAGGRLDGLPAAAQGLPREAARDHRRSTASC